MSRFAKTLAVTFVVVVAAGVLPAVVTAAIVPVTVTITSVTNINSGDSIEEPFGPAPDFYTNINIGNQSWFTSPVLPNAAMITPGWTVTRNVSTRQNVPIRIEIWDKDPVVDELVDVDPAVCPGGGLLGCSIATVGRPAVDFRGLDLDVDGISGAVTGDTSAAPTGGTSTASACTGGTEGPAATVCFTISVGAPISGETLVVTKTADTHDGSCTPADCSLREAIDRATALDTISLPASSAPYQLTTELETFNPTPHLEIRKPVTIVGPSGGGTAIIQQTQPFFRVFDVFSSGDLTLSNVTIRGGDAGPTSTAFSPHIHGGAIHNHGMVTLTNVTITGNHAQRSDVPSLGGGGGIYNAGSATLTMANVTIAGNDAAVGGGGLAGGGTIYASNVLIVGNTGPAGNCSVANPGPHGEEEPIDLGGNVQFPGSSCGIGFLTLSASPIGPLGADGTYPLLPGSQAIDAGTNNLPHSLHCAAADQLGVSRPLDGDGNGIAVCDPGAIEYDPTDVGVVHQPLDSATGQPGPVRLTFDRVVLAGFTTLSILATGPAPPAGYRLGAPARYYDLATTATFSGPITVCVDYTGTVFANESTLRLFHRTATGWSDETVSLDTNANTICGQAAGLSLFAVFEAVDASIAATGASFSATEGTSFSGTVASFADPDTAATASEYSASIDWGDGSALDTGTIIGGSGSFDVSGSHTYEEEGSRSVTVKITDLDDAGNTATASSTANVADASLAPTCSPSATASNPVSGNIAGFSDADPNGTLSDYTAAIDWGDGSSSAGTVAGPNGGPFNVRGSHIYSSTGFFTISIQIADIGGSKTSTSCQMLIYAFAPGGGAFAIGDRNSALGTPVTFWGAQWSKLNSLTGSGAPASFKGFAKNPSTPSCGTGWSTDPANSAPPPPSPLPAYMGVLVTNSTSKSGSQISGTTPHIVVVRTNVGYAPNPSNAGTGTIVSQLC